MKSNQKSVNTIRQKGVTPKFRKMLNEFTKEHEDVLKELAKR